MASRGPESELNRDTNSLRKEARTKKELRLVEEDSARRRSLATMAEHLMQPATVHSLEVHGARNTRRSFLDPVLQPLVDSGRNVGTTLGDVLTEVQEAVSKLERFDIFKPAPTVHLSDARARDPQAAATDLDIAIRVAEQPRFRLNTGTDLGNTEGSAYGNLLWRNMFGGAETLSLSARAGTRTRSAYSAALSAPLASNPDLVVTLEGLASATQKPWASHEEALHGGSLRLGWRSAAGHVHSFAYSSTWRQVTGLAGTSASPSVRADGGDSLKAALAHTFVCDRRDSPLLPQQGYLVRTAAELAGWGPLGGDVSFAKAEAELSGALPVSLPFSSSSSSLSFPSPSGISVGAGLRAGLMYPLPFGYKVLSGTAAPSRINDRFLLGGPSDVRGFKIGGLGPHDGADAVGGDVFAAGGINALLPVTRAGAASPLRLQLFANSGCLVALRHRKTKTPDEGPPALHSDAVARSVVAAVQDLANGLPSTAVGFGLVYAHPVARFELNFSLPLVLRRGEESRKGLQVGVGINFL
ncbi:mitochondrial outer membrane protein [Grosmannia clavigera kw1407]|uniref:Mitochondrial outer membrane protein n=1 Tax=Grosmannia clavigera (strain kw1407 / UAMH 11150) TaxID=655863 RepID=F0XP60_GROCL|nr:mitochondrial outer membrane protein [Grosmannia clavigera kw1407]EFX00640.1 mitochondrial outer membrane protein [Grosmannia clavigera kw1407]